MITAKESLILDCNCDTCGTKWVTANTEMNQCPSCGENTVEFIKIPKEVIIEYKRPNGAELYDEPIRKYRAAGINFAAMERLLRQEHNATLTRKCIASYCQDMGI